MSFPELTGGERIVVMQPMATVSARAVERLKEDLNAPDGEGKAVRIVFQGFG